MRILAGQLKGRRLAVAVSVRPSGARLRRALFDVLEHGGLCGGVAGARILDIFAGSGALGLEALSRGAAALVLVERNPAAVAMLRRTLADTGELARHVRLFAADALSPAVLAALAPESHDLAFFDPPYRERELLERALGRYWSCLVPGGLAVVETACDGSFGVPEGYRRLRELRCGQGRVCFLAKGGQSVSPPC